MIVNHKVFFAAVCLFLLACFSGFSQNAKIDSLKSIVETGVKDTLMVTRLNRLCNELLKAGSFPEAQIYGQQSVDLANLLDYKKGKAYAQKYLGNVEYYQGNYLQVLDYWTQSLETFESIQDTLGLAGVVGNIGAVYYQQGSHPKALDYYLQSLKFSEKIKDSFNISRALVNIGGLYAEMLDYEKALQYFFKVKKYRNSETNPGLNTQFLIGVGEIYLKQGRLDDALKYYKDAIESAPFLAKADILNKTGEVELKRGNNSQAIEYFEEASEIAKNNNQQIFILQSLINLAKTHKKNDLNKAISFYKKAENLGKEMGSNDELRDIYEGLSQTYASKGDYATAFKYQTLYIVQKDFLFNLETDDKIRGVQFDFDLQKKEDQIGLLEKESEIQHLKEKRQKIIIYSSGLAIVLIVLLALSIFRRYKFVKETNLIIAEEKNRSEKLLHNILPEETALELKQNGKVKAKKFDSVTVLFADFQGFTHFAKDLSPEALVNSVDYYFSKFDEIMKKYGLEKIKTIGDAYMCAGGLPFATEDHAVKMVLAAFEIIDFIEDSKKNLNKTITHFDARIGINTGSVVAGVVGIHKFAYDIWGDTVNVASRMETNSKPGRINISENTYKLVKNDFICNYRGEIEVKNRGFMKMYFVNGIKETIVNNTIAKNNTVLI